jgi:hypothetical protein
VFDESYGYRNVDLAVAAAGMAADARYRCLRRNRVPSDEIAIAAAPRGPGGCKQVDRFEEICLALSVISGKEGSAGTQRQFERFVVPVVLQDKS